MLGRFIWSLSTTLYTLGYVRIGFHPPMGPNNLQRQSDWSTLPGDCLQSIYAEKFDLVLELLFCRQTFTLQAAGKHPYVSMTEQVRE